MMVEPRYECAIEGIATEEMPPCFDTVRQYRQWRIAAADATKVGCAAPASGYCTDCTGAYQLYALAAGKCIHPETEFFEDPDEPGAVMGMRSV